MLNHQSGGELDKIDSDDVVLTLKPQKRRGRRRHIITGADVRQRLIYLGLIGNNNKNPLPSSKLAHDRQQQHHNHNNHDDDDNDDNLLLWSRCGYNAVWNKNKDFYKNDYSLLKDEICKWIEVKNFYHVLFLLLLVCSVLTIERFGSKVYEIMLAIIFKFT
jgi:hypothetical protein